MRRIESTTDPDSAAAPEGERRTKAKLRMWAGPDRESPRAGRAGHRGRRAAGPPSARSAIAQVAALPPGARPSGRDKGFTTASFVGRSARAGVTPHVAAQDAVQRD